jgi:acyl-CoA synthetase (AMP-forming)/AMP-acid ligase II
MKVPAIVGALIKNPFLFQMFDLSSVKTIISGSAPFDKNLGEAVKQVRPDWKILPGYGKYGLSSMDLDIHALSN